MTEAALTISDLHVALGRPQKSILHGVSLSIAPGEVVALIGETGSGKSTLARTVLGLSAASAGRISVAGQRIDQLRGRALRALRRSGRVQYVFQDPLRSLDPDFTVARSVLEGVPRGIRRDERERILASTLAQVGLDPALSTRVPADLSGGQRQRVAIARALAVEPDVLLCDEPVSALDAASRIAVLELIRRVTSERVVGTLLITHDLGSLLDVADRIAVLFEGRIVEVGPTARVLGSPAHDYTKLLVASVPPLHRDALPATERRALRARVDALAGTPAE